MKKSSTIILALVLMSGLVLAAGGQGQQDSSGQNYEAAAQQIENTIRQQVRSGNYTLNGSKLMLQQMSNNRLQLKSGNTSAKCDCNLTEEFNETQNRIMLKVQLSNGKYSEIKVMPDRASETALQRLRLKNCNESKNCTIELKEVGQGNQTRAAYEVKTQRSSKLFGLFKKQMKVEAQVDAETGELIRTNKPWWAFLASEKEE